MFTLEEFMLVVTQLVMVFQDIFDMFDTTYIVPNFTYLEFFISLMFLELVWDIIDAIIEG